MAVRGDSPGVPVIRVDQPGNVKWRRRMDEYETPAILELGTLRWQPDVPTHHKEWVPRGRWTLADITAGVDVDVVADAHDLAPFDDNSFDGYFADAVWEHVERPWLCAQAAARVVKPGGLLYVNAPQTFPIHGYPSDYFRFSAEALRVMVSDAGFDTVYAGHALPCQITPPDVIAPDWNWAAEAFLAAEIVAVRR